MESLLACAAGASKSLAYLCIALHEDLKPEIIAGLLLVTATVNAIRNCKLNHEPIVSISLSPKAK